MNQSDISEQRHKYQWPRAFITYALLLILFEFSVVDAQADGETVAQTTPTLTTGQAYEAIFNFIKHDVDGITVYIHNVLEDQADSLIAEVQTFAKGQQTKREEFESLLNVFDLILMDIHRLTGMQADESMVASQRKKVEFFLMQSLVLQPERRTIIYMMEREQLKDKLRQDVKLPYFQYKDDEDKVNYEWRWDAQGDHAHLSIPLIIPIPLEAQDAASSAKVFFNVISQVSQQFSMGLALHEVIELCILNRLKPGDPWWRWFSDGYANALAIHLLEKHIGQEQAAMFAQLFEPEKHGENRNKVNLLYWPGGYNVEIDSLPHDGQIKTQRYCWATHEARRIMNKHGPQVVARILEKATGNPPTTLEQLAKAMYEVTGEDPRQQLLQYQTYQTIEQGHQQFMRTYQQAANRGDKSTAAYALLRAIELAGDDPHRFRQGLLALHNHGTARKAFALFKQRVDLAMSFDHEDDQVAWLQSFLQYANQTRTVGLASEEIDFLYDLQPDNAWAIYFKAINLARQKQYQESANLAQRLASPDYSPMMREKAQILLQKLNRLKQQSPIPPQK